MKAHGASNPKVALVWAVAGAFATAAILPYAFALMPALAARVKVPFIILAAAQSLQASVLLFALCWTGLRCGAVAALDSPIVRSALAGERVATRASLRRAAIGVVLGCAIAVIIFVGTAAFAIHMPVPSAALPQITLWKRLLASLYGGVVEEAVFRLFLVSLIAWSLAKLFYKRSATLPRWAAWARSSGRRCCSASAIYRLRSPFGRSQLLSCCGRLSSTALAAFCSAGCFGAGASSMLSSRICLPI